MLLRQYWSVHVVSVPWELKQKFDDGCYTINQPLRDSPHNLTSHLHERRLVKLSLRVEELPLVPPDGDGLGRLS